MGANSRLRRSQVPLRSKKPLTRKTTMKRTRMKRKRRRNDKPELRYEFLQIHSNCALCHAGWREFDNPLEVHHIVSGSGRADVLENLLTLCRRCHFRYHNIAGADGIAPGVLLTAKREQSPEHYSEQVICELLGRQALPERWEPTPIPEQFLRMREENMR